MHKKMTFSGFVYSVSIFAISCCVSWASDSIPAPSPTTTIQGARGMTYTVSAEPLGAGRIVFSLLGTGYRQSLGFRGTPPEGSKILTGIASFAYGINSHIDLFASFPAFLLVRSSPAKNSFGFGSISSGLAGSLPFSETSPFHLGTQLSVVAGTSINQINRNNEDGYNYFETRTGFDFMGKILETLEFGNEYRGIKIHLNQGFVSSVESGHDALLLLGGGIQGMVHRMLSIGLEINSRTSLNEIAFSTDPLWITPSLYFRTPYYFSMTLGADISLSNDRSKKQPRALEPFRMTGGIVFSFDALARNRRESAEAEQLKAKEKAEAERKALQALALADSLAKKAYNDSLAMAAKLVEERKREQMMIKKAQEDSIALAETKRKLQEEKSRRSEAENQLLTTGLLLLDAVYFNSGRSDISINSRQYLTIIAKMLVKYPKLRIEIGGHTDNTGQYQTNMNLSYTRAKSVGAFLVQSAPELGERITPTGYGPSAPKADNRTAAGREMNRRVELKVLNKEVLKEYNE